MQMSNGADTTVLPVDMHNQDEVNVCGASGGVDAFARPLGRHTASLDAHGGLGTRAGARVGLGGGKIRTRLLWRLRGVVINSVLSRRPPPPLPP